MTAHAKFSASGSSRWIACPASIQMEEGHPDQSSPYALEGSIAHQLGEMALVSARDCRSFVGQSIRLDDKAMVEAWVVDEAMADYVQEYVDYVRALPGELHFEQRVDFSLVVPDGFGTADAIAYDADNKTLHVVDLKYGQGVRVEAHQNSQAQLYAIGAMNDFSWLGEIENVRCVIVQPRLDHVSEWETTRQELTEFARVANGAAINALSDAPTFGPSESACRFCKAAGKCRPLAEHNLGLAVQDFNEETMKMDLKQTNTLAGAELAYIIANAKLVTEWIKAVESRAISEIDHGHEIPGFKLVEGRSIRKWTDEREAEKALLAEVPEEEVFTRKLISPTQAEKILGKKHQVITDQVTKPAGKPTLVPESDKRPALKSSAERDFA